MEGNVFQMYLDEIQDIKVCDETENKELLMELAAGNDSAAARLIEGNLKNVLAQVQAYLNKGVLAADLVQEANMALVLAVESYKEMMKEGSEPKGFYVFLQEQVKDALEAAVAEQSAEKQVEDKMLARVNVLKDISSDLAQSLGREATVEELAERMQMTEDEVKDIMKLTLDAMSVTGEYAEEMPDDLNNTDHYDDSKIN